MARPYILLIATALLAAGASAQTGSVHERNVAFFLSMIGDDDLAMPVAVSDGRVVPLAQALDEAAERVGDVEVAALLAGAVDGSDTFVGSAVAIELGSGPCPPTVGVPQPFFVPVDPQTWIPGGYLGVRHGNALALYTIDWTTKETGSGSGPWRAIGSIDDYCFGFGGSYFAIPFASGVITVGGA